MEMQPERPGTEEERGTDGRSAEADCVTPTPQRLPDRSPAYDIFSDSQLVDAFGAKMKDFDWTARIGLMASARSHKEEADRIQAELAARGVSPTQ